MFVENFSLNKLSTEYIRRKPKDAARRSEKETKSHPAKKECLPPLVTVVQSSSSKHILPTDLKKCETVDRFISPLLKNRNPKCGTRNRGWVSIKIDSFMKNMALIAELDIKARKLTNHSVRKTIVKKLKASNQPRSAINGVTGHEKRAFTRTLLISSSVCQEVQFVHSAHPYSDSSLLKSSSPFSRLLGDDRLLSWRWCWEKLIRGAAVTTKTVI